MKTNKNPAVLARQVFHNGDYNASGVEYLLTRNQGTDLFTCHYAAKITRLIHIENHYWEIIFHAKSESCHIHNPQILTNTFRKSNSIEFCSGWILFGVRTVNAINPGSFQNNTCIDLNRTK